MWIVVISVLYKNSDVEIDYVLNVIQYGEWSEHQYVRNFVNQILILKTTNYSIFTSSDNKQVASEVILQNVNYNFFPR